MRQLARRMPMNKLCARFSFVEYQIDRGLTCRPRIDEQRTAGCFKGGGSFIAQIVERFSQRRTPGLVPAGLATGLTAAIANPAADTVGTTPRAPFALWASADFDFHFRWVPIQIFAIVCDRKSARGRIDRQRVSQAKFAKLVMMPVGLTVSCDIYQIRVLCASLREAVN